MPEYYLEYPSESFFDQQAFSTGVLQFAFSIAFVVALFVSLISIVTYIFNSLAIYEIARRRGIQYAIFAFIPVCSDLLLGSIADDINKTMNKKTNYAIKLVILNAIVSTLSLVVGMFMVIFSAMQVVGMLILCYLVFFIVQAITICYSVYYYIVLYRIFNEYAPSSAVLFEILSILFGINAFLLFAIRNNKSGYQLWREEMEREREKAEHPEKFIDGYTTPVYVNENPET
ncbi:MAG: hypothetical protein IJ408_02590 [Clostridia bacterium]|nr:hypothetical protein [Clostridia bacterium]